MGAIAGGAALGYHWLTSSPRFALAGIDVRGTEKLDQEQIVALLSPALEQNVFRIPLEAVEQRLIEQPWIERAEVSRRLPNRIAVEVVERSPAAVVELGGLYLAQRDGRVFKRADVSRGEGVGMPVITGLSRTQYSRNADHCHQQIASGLDVLDMWRSSADRPAIGEVHLDANRGVTLYLESPPVGLFFGHTDERETLTQRMAVFDAAWAALDESERSEVASLHLDRDGWPARVAVAFHTR